MNIYDFNKPILPKHSHERHEPDIKLIYDDYIKGLSKVEDHSVQLIIATCTDNVNKELIDLDKLWQEYRRILRQHGTILIVGKEPWMSKVRLSNEDHYYYDWSWTMPNCIAKPISKLEPVDSHRQIAMFAYENPYYKPLFRPVVDYCRTDPIVERNNCLFTEYQPHKILYPRNVIDVHTHIEEKDLRIHNPYIEYIEYLIETYTKPHDTVLDNFMGIGDSCVAALKHGRNFIGIESELELYEGATEHVDYAKKYLADHIRHHNDLHKYHWDNHCHCGHRDSHCLDPFCHNHHEYHNHSHHHYIDFIDDPHDPRYRF